MNQKQLILKHLRTGANLTILEALGVYRIFNLKARINELRKAGYDIRTEMRVDHTGKQYASYSLKEAA